VTLSPDDVALLDEYARAAVLTSRSAALQHAIRLLPIAGLERDYAAAWAEWQEGGDATAWETTTGGAWWSSE
jgi:hypothetical protein